MNEALQIAICLAAACVLVLVTGLVARACFREGFKLGEIAGRLEPRDGEGTLPSPAELAAEEAPTGRHAAPAAQWPASWMDPELTAEMPAVADANGRAS